MDPRPQVAFQQILLWCSKSNFSRSIEIRAGNPLRPSQHPRLGNLGCLSPAPSETGLVPTPCRLALRLDPQAPHQSRTPGLSPPPLGLCRVSSTTSGLGFGSVPTHQWECPGGSFVDCLDLQLDQVQFPFLIKKLVKSF